jgi:hypothetical protein
MADKSGDVGSIRPIKGYSTELNSQKQVGCEKPSFKGKENPGDTKPKRDMEKPVPMPK